MDLYERDNQITHTSTAVRVGCLLLRCAARWRARVSASALTEPVFTAPRPHTHIDFEVLYMRAEEVPWRGIARIDDNTPPHTRPLFNL